jgi:hypothetical protein
MASKDDNTIYKGIYAAFLILIMHVLLLGSIGLLVLLFYGIINHMVWIAIAASCLTVGGYWLYRRIKSDGSVLKNVAGGSLKGKTVEVNFLGGIANFKISDTQTDHTLLQDSKNQPRQLEAPKPDNATTLTELARLYENKIITIEEFNKAKQDLFD